MLFCEFTYLCVVFSMHWVSKCTNVLYLQYSLLGLYDEKGNVKYKRSSVLNII